MNMMKGRAFRATATAAMLAVFGAPVMAEELFYVSGAVGNAVEDFKTIVKPWEEATGNTVTLVPMPSSTTDQFGQYRLWLAAGATDIDLYQTDVIWAPQLSNYFVDLTEPAKDLVAQHFPAVIQSQTADGKLVALPILYSTPVLFYNKNAMRKAGLDPETPPKTWFEMQGVLDKLQAAGYDCPYSSSWPSWVHLDNVSAVSGTPAIDSKGNLKFNALPQVKHVAMMATWTKARYFRLYGHTDEASQQFRNGQCAMLTTDSREYASFQDARGVELGVAPLPYHDDVFGGRRPSLADGPSLWVGAGKPAAEYKVAAKFVSFLLSPKIQVELVRHYGGLPLTEAARKAASSELLQDGRQMLEAAYASLQGKAEDTGIRLANIDRARLIADEELDAVWNDKKPAKAALDTAVSRGNAVLASHPLMKKSQPF